MAGSGCLHSRMLPAACETHRCDFVLQAAHALRMCYNNVASACQWLLSHPEDSIASAAASVPAADAQPQTQPQPEPPAEAEAEGVGGVPGLESSDDDGGSPE